MITNVQKICIYRFKEKFCIEKTFSLKAMKIACLRNLKKFSFLFFIKLLITVQDSN